MDRGAWQATVHGVAKSWTRLRDFTHTQTHTHTHTHTQAQQSTESIINVKQCTFTFYIKVHVYF